MNMETDDLTFGEVLDRLVNQRRSRDPRGRRVASVTSSLMEVVAGQADSASSLCSAAQIYAQGMTALEGTILRKTGDTAEVNESLGTQVAILEVLSETVPFVEPAQIIVATIAVPSRVLRSMVSFCQSVDSIALDTEDELGGVSAVLRSIAKTCGQITVKLQRTKPDLKMLQQFWRGTLLALVSDSRPKVRKTAFNTILEVLADPNACLPAIQNETSAFLGNSLRQTRKQVRAGNMKDVGTVLPIVDFLERVVIHIRSEKVLVDVMELLTVLLQSETEAMMGANATNPTTDFVAITKQKRRSDGGTPLLVINALMGVIRTALDDAEKSFELSQFASRVVASLLTAQPAWIFRPGTAEASSLRVGRTIWGQVLIVGSRRILDDGQLEVAFKVLPLVGKMVLLLAKPCDDTDEDEASVAFQLFVDLTQFFREYFPPLQNKGAGALIHAITVSLEQVLQPAYRPTWAVSLKAFVICLQYTEEDAYASDKVEALILQRTCATCSPSAKNAIDDALSTLVQAAGLEKVWTWIKWPDNETTARERGWLLEVLKSAGQTAQPFPLELSFFQDEILVLARRFDRAAATGSARHKHENRLGVVNAWKLLPCFFIQLPPDVSERLASLTTTMGKALEDQRYPELTPIICHSIALLAKCGEYHIELNGDVLEGAATTLLPLLFKLSMAPPKDATPKSASMDTEHEGELREKPSADVQQKMQVLGDAICCLCTIADKSFLQGLFKKLMHRLLEEMQHDIPSEEQLCAYLSLSQSLVKSGSLEEDSIDFLFRASRPLLRDGQHGPRPLKRAYKLLTEICDKYASYFSEGKRLNDLSELLKEDVGTSQVAARYLRLKCFSRVVEGLEIDSTTPAVLESILSVTSEILLCLKDSNGKTRDAAFELLIAIAERTEYNTILRILSAGLASETPHMRSAAVMALSRVVFELMGHQEQVQASLPSLLKTILCLLAEESREVIKSVVGFVRVCVTVIPKDQLEPLLPELVGNLMKYHKVKERFRSKVKIILKKLVKRYGYEGIIPHVPQSEARLLTHMRKIDQRLKRRKTLQNTTDTATKHGFDDFLDSDEEDSDNGRTLVTTVAGDALTKASRQSKRTRATSVSRRGTKIVSNIQLPSEADGNIVDMLGSAGSKKVSFLQKEDIDDSSHDDVVEFNDEGMLVVHEAADQETGLSDGDLRKRRRLTKSEGESVVRTSHTKTNRKSADLGRAYRSKRAGGDVKRKEQNYEPYAFVPLNAKSYSKKHRKHAVESMTSVVRNGKQKK